MDTTVTTVIDQAGIQERRRARRSKIARKTLIRSSQPPFSEEVQPTTNFTRGGLYFVTASRHYYVGMRVGLIAGYVPNDPCNSTSFGEVIRIDKLEDGKMGIAVRIQLA